METIRRFIFGRRIYFMAFLFSCIAMAASFIIFGIFPFGQKSVLTVDLSQQYVQIFSEFRNIITNGKSVFYSWNAGMGLNFFGLFAYYLMSPFNLIILLLPESLIIEAITLIIVLKAGISGVTFTFFARNVLNSNALTGLAFSLMYSMSSWAVVFYSNLMWLDALMVLPLVIYSVSRLINNGKYFGLIASLFYIFITQYYMSYMVGIFAFLSFICFCCQKYKLSDIKKIIQLFLKFMMCAVLSLGMAAVILLPTFSVMTDGMGLLGQTLPSMSLSFSPVEMPQMLFNGAFSGMLANKFPNIYCGLLSIILLPIYFLNTKIQRRERIVSGSLLSFMIITMILMPTNIMWQFFDEPNGFYGRYTFLISFILLCCACRAFMNIDGVKAPVPLISSSVLMLYLIVAYFTFNDKILTDTSLWINISLVIIFTIFIYFSIIHFRSIKSIHYVLICIAFFDVILNSVTVLNRIDALEGVSKRSEYASSATALRNASEELASIDKSFYRMEKNFNRDYNDTMAGHYRGIAHYSSTTSVNLNSALANLGYLAQDNYRMWVLNRGSTRITDSIFSVKYYLSKDEDVLDYRRFLNTDRFKVYQNTRALPLGFTVSDEILDLSLPLNDPISAQEKLLTAMIGKENKHNNLFYDADFTVVLENIKTTEKDGKKVFLQDDDSQKARIKFLIEESDSDDLYAFFESDTRADASVSCNGKLLVNSFRYSSPYIYQLNSNELTIEFDGRISFIPHFAYLSGSVFSENISRLKTDISIVSFSDSELEFSGSSETDCVFFTSIPYNKGWIATVNGEKAETTAVVDEAFLAIKLPAGQADISLKFIPPGFYIGLSVSIFSVLIVFALYIFKKRQE